MKRPSRPSRLLILAILAGIAVLAWREWRLLPDGRFHAYFLDVGQGDSALLVTPGGKQILIDGGPDLSALERLGERLPFFDRSLDLLVLSHPNLDHYASFAEVLRRYRVGAVLFTGALYPAARYQEFLAMIRARRIPIIVADPGKDVDLGDGVTLDIVWPPATLLGKNLPTKDANNASVALCARYEGRAILFTGDMEEKEERAILASRQDIRADVLKVAHHGSRTSSGTGFLLAVSPSLAVISLGRDNAYGHPHREILERFRHFGIPVRTTMDGGTIEVTW